MQWVTSGKRGFPLCNVQKLTMSSEIAGKKIQIYVYATAIRDYNVAYSIYLNWDKLGEYAVSYLNVFFHKIGPWKFFDFNT